MSWLRILETTENPVDIFESEAMNDGVRILPKDCIELKRSGGSC